MTPPGIDPWTVRLVAQRLNPYATPGPYLFILVTENAKKKAAHKYFRQVFLSLRFNKGIVLILRDTFVRTDISKLPSFHCDDGIKPNEIKDGWKQRMCLLFILRLYCIIIIIIIIITLY